MNIRKTILASTAIAGFAFVGLTQAQAETSLFEKIRNAIMPSAETNVEMTAENETGDTLQDMVPPAVEPAAGTPSDEIITDVDMQQWENVPGTELGGQTFVPVEEETAARSGFSDPIDPNDPASLNAIESAAGNTVAGEMDSTLGFEDPSSYTAVEPTTDTGADLIDIMPAAGDAEEGDMVDEAEAMMEDSIEVTEEVAEDVAEGAEDIVEEMGEMTEEAAEGAEEMIDESIDQSEVDMDGEYTEEMSDEELDAQMNDGVDGEVIEDDMQ